jgi:AbrB family looped-hinge helix DNA binding protein
MTYSTTITKKGQITIPKQIRVALGLRETDKFLVELPQRGNVIKVTPVEDFIDIAKGIKMRKKIDPVKARELMEEKYERK